LENREAIYYCIGDVVFKIVSDLPYPIIDQNAKDFLIDERAADYTFIFQKVRSITQIQGKNGKIHAFDNGYDTVGENGQSLRAFLWKNGFYDILLKYNGKENIISYLSAQILAERCANGFNFTNYLALERVFLERGGLLLHSAHINIGGQALLFSAPSGTGKSTQAALWQEHAGAEIINGDRSLLRKKDGVWHAYGCPMCGTSGIHKQGNEPIHAIVMLSQGTENTVRRLGAGEAFQRIYPEITVPKWNRELVLRAMELLDDVMANVPIYAFSCTKDESAVTALRKALGL